MARARHPRYHDNRRELTDLMRDPWAIACQSTSSLAIIHTGTGTISSTTSPSVDTTPDNRFLCEVVACHAALGIPRDYALTRSLPLETPPPFWIEDGMDLQGRPVRLAPEASRAFRALVDAARDAGFVPVVVSSYRSLAHQARLVRQALDRGQPLEGVLRRIAPPGFSEHHSGRAVDLSVAGEREPLTEAFEDTAFYRWLGERAGGFGFRLSYPRNNRAGFIYEPWHWAYRADPTA